jgi:flagellin
VTSILANNGAMIALQSLESTNANLTRTQNEISTGSAISTKDNASIWTVVTTVEANVATLAQVSTDPGNAESILGTAPSGATQGASLVSQIRAQVVSFTDPAANVPTSRRRRNPPALAHQGKPSTFLFRRAKVTERPLAP